MKEADSGREEIGKERAKTIGCRGDENLTGEELKKWGGELYKDPYTIHKKVA